MGRRRVRAWGGGLIAALTLAVIATLLTGGAPQPAIEETLAGPAVAEGATSTESLPHTPTTESPPGEAAAAEERESDTGEQDEAADPASSPEPSPLTGGETCETFSGQPLVVGPTVQVEPIGEVNGVRVEAAMYPHPNYEGNPWSQWGQGIVLEDGRFLSAIGDHIGPDGNSYLYEYDPRTGELSMIGDVLSYVEHQEGSWGYGKVHGQMVPGPCGEVYLSTYWGTSRGLEFSGSYRGDVLMRLDPEERTIESLGVPVELHGQASLASSVEHGLVFGEAVDPLRMQDGGVKEGPLFVYDMTTGEVVATGPRKPHVGYRSILVDREGRAYYSIGDGALAVFDPDTGEIYEHPHRMPGAWLRAATPPTPDGSVIGVTREPDRFFVMSADGQISDLGDAAGYTTSLALSPDGSRVYYMPGAHGNAWRQGSPVIEIDVATGRQEVLVELNAIVEEALGYTVGGTYNIAISPDGQTIYVGANASPLGNTGGFGEVIMIAVHLK